MWLGSEVTLTREALGRVRSRELIESDTLPTWIHQLHAGAVWDLKPRGNAHAAVLKFGDGPI